MNKQVVRSALVAAVSSALTIGLWTSITPASAGDPCRGWYTQALLSRWYKTSVCVMLTAPR